MLKIFIFSIFIYSSYVFAEDTFFITTLDEKTQHQQFDPYLTPILTNTILTNPIQKQNTKFDTNIKNVALNSIEFLSTYMLNQYLPNDFSLLFDYQNRKNSDCILKEKYFMFNLSKKI